jgi:O-antigen/teichoic acid export membrane protein
MTDPAPRSVLARTAAGAGWIIGWRMVTRVLGLMSTLILVRLLLPADFGLVTLAMGFGQALDSLSSMGVEEAVVRERAPSRDLYDSAFTINLLRGLASAAILAAGAWPVAAFFADDRLVAVMLALAAGAGVTAFESIGIVDFRRDIAFEKEFLLMTVPRIVSIAVAISMAFVWRNYWALVAAILTSTVLRTAMTYAMHPYRPRLSLRAWRQIASFSFWSWAISVASLLRDRVDNFVIGRVLGITQVGIFSVGAEIAALPSTELVSPLARACFSGFSASRHSGEAGEAARAFLRVIGSATLIALPAGFGVSLVADPLVRLAFGARWAGAAGLVEILGVAFTFTILGLISAALLQAYAVLRPMFWVQAGAVAARIALLVVLVDRAGLLGAAAGVAIATAFENILLAGMTLRRLHLPARALWRHTWRAMLATGAMAAVLISTGLGWHAAGEAHPATALAEGVALGAAAYAACVAALWTIAGRPPGAEQDMLAVLAGIARRTRRMFGIRS